MLHYLIVHTKKGDFTVRGSMKNIMGMLSASFARSSNSYIVNLRHVDGVKDNVVTVHGVPVPVTKSYKADFLRAFNAYNGVT